MRQSDARSGRMKWREGGNSRSPRRVADTALRATRYGPALVLLWSIPVSAAPPALCADAPDQTAMTICARDRLKAAEVKLGKAQAALRAKLDPLGRHNLDRAQRAWRTFRQLECDLETGHDTEHPERNGTIMPMLLGECAVTLTERRTRDLTEQLACPGGDLSCERSDTPSR